jgi:hypothetical protein
MLQISERPQAWLRWGLNAASLDNDVAINNNLVAEFLDNNPDVAKNYQIGYASVDVDLSKFQYVDILWRAIREKLREES